MKTAVFLLASAFLVATSKGDIDLERLRHGDIRHHQESLFNVTKKTPFSMMEETAASLERRLFVFCTNIDEEAGDRFCTDFSEIIVDDSLPPFISRHRCPLEGVSVGLEPKNRYCFSECKLTLSDFFEISPAAEVPSSPAYAPSAGASSAPDSSPAVAPSYNTDSESQQGRCQSCTWLYDGSFAYDCSNLYPDNECAIKNARGECGTLEVEQMDTINCTQSEGYNFAFRCFDENINIVLGESDNETEVLSVTPVHECYTELITELDPLNGQCDGFCFLINGDNEWCTSCTWLGKGEYAYDCSNLYPDAECATRNSQGECGEETFLTWFCEEGIGPDGGTYYRCEATRFNYAAEGMRNPAFVFDDILIEDSYLELHCLNRMSSGMHPTDCQEPVCVLAPTNDGRCDSCQILDVQDASTQWITYDCVNAPGSESVLSCPRLLPNGTCTDIPATPNFPFSNFTVGETPDDDAEDDDGRKTWILRNINPTTFNVMTDVFDKIVMIMFGIAVATIYPSFMRWKVYHGLEVPVDTLGDVPSDFWAVLTGYQAWRTSWPTILLVILVVAADFSHSIADSGLDFVTVDEKGPEARILFLALNPNARNKYRPAELLGDPPGSRGLWEPTSLYESLNAELQIEEEEKLESFLKAIALMARGGSPFTQESEFPARIVDVEFGGVEKPEDNAGFILRYVDGDAQPLVQISTELPFQCTGPAMNISQISFGDPDFERPIHNLAVVPDCDLTSLRSSGIFPRPSSKKLQILETVSIGGVSGQDNILLMKGNETFMSFEATPPSKQLGRDRKDFLGREFFDIDGIQVGNITISFESVYLASGIEDIDDVNTGQSQKKYFLVAQADKGQCPERPSLLSSNGTECIVDVILSCESFPEDSQRISHPIYGQKKSNSICKLFSVSVAWGKFPMDAEVAAVTAGVLGLIRPAVLDDVFVMNSIPAAFFAMSTMETRPSIEQKVRPRINFTFAFFMLLPLSTAIVMWMVGCLLQKRSDVIFPDTVWEGIVIGAENPSLVDSKRKYAHDPFPSPPEDVVFKLIDKDEDGAFFFDAVDDDDGKTAMFGIVKKHAQKDEETAP